VADSIARSADEAVDAKLRSFMLEHWSDAAFSEGFTPTPPSLRPSPLILPCPGQALEHPVASRTACASPDPDILAWSPFDSSCPATAAVGPDARSQPPPLTLLPHLQRTLAALSGS
jgi:hypothetical protein